jgi:hypothetical protein
MAAVKNRVAFAQVLLNHNQRIETIRLNHPIDSTIPLPSPLIRSIEHNNRELLLLLFEAGAALKSALITESFYLSQIIP